MTGSRPFDDDRWPDEEGFACCFICGRKVDPSDPNRGTYEIFPAGVKAPIHVPCAAKLISEGGPLGIEIRYRAFLDEAVRHPASTGVH